MTEHAASSLPDPVQGPSVDETGIVGAAPNAPTDAAIPAVLVTPPDMKWVNSGAAPSPWREIRAQGSRPLRWREILTVVLLVVLADITLFRSNGFAGCAALFALAPVLLVWGSPRPKLRTSFWIVGLMLWLLAGRMLWLGSPLGVAAGFALLIAVSLAIVGRRPYVLDILACLCLTPAAGYRGLSDYQRSAGQLRRRGPTGYLLSVGLPLAALAVFGTLFVMANPDVARSVGDAISRLFRTTWDWLSRFVPSWGEILFWFVAGWASIGLLRPVLRRSVLSWFLRKTPFVASSPKAQAAAPLYGALRNMLAAVIVLFLGYLVFEFQTLWFKEFPKGFYYAGYAHEGAAWLTIALALATGVLSLVFRGRVLSDPRLPQLRRLAWLWSAENLILATAVYNRLWIYMSFNGMTRMRTVGIFGTSAVVVGFILVVWKIAYQRDFVWLLRRHLWTLALAAYLFALTPVDALVHSYNVRRVLAGDLAPSVQIGWHPVDSEGLLVLTPLLESDDPILREGIQALLAERAQTLQAARGQRSPHDWTAYQLADETLAAKLESLSAEWQPFADPAKRAAAWDRFREYVYQWY